MRRNPVITLDCGVRAETWKHNKSEYIEIYLNDLYGGHGELNNPILLSKLFAELAEKGYKLQGISLEHGFYNCVDGMSLTATKEIVKK